MDPRQRIAREARRVSAGFTVFIRALVCALGVLSGLGILTMMLVTCLDVLLRPFRVSLTGAVDIVQVAGTITIAGALPYTTAVKGHVAIEYFFQKLSRRNRIIVDTVVRLLGMGLFALLAWESMLYGLQLRQVGRVTSTLEIPLFWVAHVVAVSCASLVLVILHNMLHPGKETIRP